MKKLLVFLAAAALAVPAGAQVFVGGALGFNYSDQIMEETSAIREGRAYNRTTSTASIVFTPTVGYRINDKWSAGLDLNLIWQKRHNKAVQSDIDIVDQTNTDGLNSLGWKISPFARYNAFKINKFGIDLELSGSIGNTKTTIDDESSLTSKKSYTQTNAQRELNYGINLSPVLTFDITEHFSLETVIGIAGIGWEGRTVTEEYSSDYGSGEPVKRALSETYNTFTFGLNNLTAVSFGCIYTF